MTFKRAGHNRYLLFGVGVALVAALALAGCGGAGSGGSETGGEGGGNDGATAETAKYVYKPVGLIKPNEVKKGLHICFFGDGSNNNYVLANNAGATAAGKVLGVPVSTQLGEWDPARQLNQIQTAISSGECSGLVVEPIDPTAVCDALTKEAAAADVPVVVVNIPICGAVDKAPGTVSFSGSQTLGYNQSYLDHVAEIASKKWPDEQIQLGAITGPPNWAGTLPPHGIKQAYDEVSEKHPNIEVVQLLSGEFTTEEGLNAAQTMLQTHPDLKVLTSSVDEQAQGAIQALQASGKKPGEVMVFGIGYNTVSQQNIEEGWQEGAMVLAPVQEVGIGVEAMAAHLSGKEVPGYIKPQESAGTEMVTKADVTEVQPEY